MNILFCVSNLSKEQTADFINTFGETVVVKSTHEVVGVQSLEQAQSTAKELVAEGVKIKATHFCTTGLDAVVSMWANLYASQYITYVACVEAEDIEDIKEGHFLQTYQEYKAENPNMLTSGMICVQPIEEVCKETTTLYNVLLEDDNLGEVCIEGEDLTFEEAVKVYYEGVDRVEANDVEKPVEGTKDRYYARNSGNSGWVMLDEPYTKEIESSKHVKWITIF